MICAVADYYQKRAPARKCRAGTNRSNLMALATQRLKGYQQGLLFHGGTAHFSCIVNY